MRSPGARALSLTFAAVLSACHSHPTVPPGHALVTVHGAGGDRSFLVELADTTAEQNAGLMHRRQLASDGGMLFAPYPAQGPSPARATMWMKDTPLPLDILFIRADHVIDSIAANARPNDETMITSNLPVAAVLEVGGGRSVFLGIETGDRVDWEIGR